MSDDLPKNALEVIEFAKKAQIKHGILTFDPLYRPNTRGKYQKWTLFVGISKNPISSDLQKDKTGAWISKVKWLKVTKDHIKRAPIPDEAVGIWWTESGQDGYKVTISNPHVFHKYSMGTGVRKIKSENDKIVANYKTAFTLAVSKAKTEYEKRTRKGDKTNKDDLLSEKKTYTIEKLIKMSDSNSKAWRVAPMAIHLVKDNWEKVKYPCYIQPKLDGTRLVVVYHPDLPKMTIIDSSGEKFKEHIDFYTRSRHQFEKGQTHILVELLKIAKKFPGLYLDGELYKPGYALQEISGSSRRILDESKSGRSKAIKLKYYIYDCFYVNEPSMPFEKRKQILDDVFAYADKIKAKNVIRVETHKASSKKDLEKYHKKFLKDKLEGSVIRNRKSPYEIGLTVERRSRQTLKWKEYEDKEFKVVDFTQGKTGKDVGLIMFILEVKNNKGEKKLFRARPAWTEENRRKWYKAMNKEYKKGTTVFEKYWKGTLGTVKFKGYTLDGVPAEPRFLRFREEKYNHLENFKI